MYLYLYLKTTTQGENKMEGSTTGECVFGGCFIVGPVEFNQLGWIPEIDEAGGRFELGRRFVLNAVNRKPLQLTSYPR